MPGLSGSRSIKAGTGPYKTGGFGGNETRSSLQDQNHPYFEMKGEAPPAKGEEDRVLKLVNKV